jgi:hypothetical protein
MVPAAKIDQPPVNRLMAEYNQSLGPKRCDRDQLVT